MPALQLYFLGYCVKSWSAHGPPGVLFLFAVLYDMVPNRCAIYLEFEVGIFFDYFC